jgi:subtilisin-like proprotein convertase family protein
MVTGMKLKLTALAVASVAWVEMAPAQGFVDNNYVFNPNVAVPDGDPNGLAVATRLTGLSGTIMGMSVTLNITGGNNSDLYVYLTGPNGGFAVLLNRVGLSYANPMGYEDTGFNITLSDSASSSVHSYQDASYALNGNGQLTGFWAPDGRNIDPQSLPAVINSAAATATLGSFQGNDANGVWTLFVADLSGGGQSTLASWSINISTEVQAVPEPSVTALVGLCAALVLARQRKAL